MFFQSLLLLSGDSRTEEPPKQLIWTENRENELRMCLKFRLDLIGNKSEIL